jgi:hypothetical protein
MLTSCASTPTELPPLSAAQRAVRVVHSNKHADAVLLRSGQLLGATGFVGERGARIEAERMGGNVVQIIDTSTSSTTEQRRNQAKTVRTSHHRQGIVYRLSQAGLVALPRPKSKK